MKRRDLVAHLHANGCTRLREGGSHSWWLHTASGKRSSVPRHTEVNNHLARKICRDLGIPEPSRF
jgi:mRNA interferase HicA